MKKLIPIIILTLLMMSSCVEKIIVNRKVDSKNDGKMLLGSQTKSQFLQEPFKTWYDEEHDSYIVNQESLSQLKKHKLNSYKITVFVGTWCSDSHREFPRLMKILETIKYSENKLTIIGVNRKKESPSGEEVKYNIQKVPTIILEKYGHEIGRIIETPNSGFLETDLAEIIKKK